MNININILSLNRFRSFKINRVSIMIPTIDDIIIEVLRGKNNSIMFFNILCPSRGQIGKRLNVMINML